MRSEQGLMLVELMYRTNKISSAMKQKKELKKLTEDQLEEVTGGQTAPLEKDENGCYIDKVTGQKKCPLRLED